MSSPPQPTNLAIFSTKPYDRASLTRTHSTLSPALRDSITLTFHDFPVSEETAPLARGAHAVCVFVNDTLSPPVLQSLHSAGVRAVLLRCAGYNNVDLATAESLGLFVARVPAYAPEAVAEFAVALVLAVNRKTHRAYNRVREGNFSLDGLMGHTMRGKTVGVVGTGKIGVAFARIMQGFGCRLLAYDPFPVEGFRELGGEYRPLEEVLKESDYVSLHCPLTDETERVINEQTLGMMKKGAVLVNTSRGGLVDTKSVIAALKSKHLGGLALDVYDGEGAIFYQDRSTEIIQDDELMRLMTFPNVVVCGHQAFFTEEALTEIAECTLRNLEDFMNRVPCPNSLVREGHLLVRRESLPVRI
ncbi:D-isomer specific 2-hydroxyacid dehydrogenase [Achaetomium macrosporum]|uniref:D-isomer specific 2-hydroxyacid dehydrogenase n=1 Tax=Achaetomium macrosporum TaxID=79813 RepID=A0AAN7CCG0_9PEZI|nr:D-isomer specific 2-hydroxyacid dehydrogenase [Achaetomium macrosporum]